MSIFIDILIVGIIGLLVFTSYKKGFISGIVGLAGFLISSVLASLLSRPIADMIFKNFIRDGLISNVNDQVKNLPIDVNISTAIDSGLNQLPEFIKNFVESNGINQTIKTIEENAAGSLNQLPEQIVDTVCAPLFITVISSILFIVLFMLFIFIFRIIGKMLNNVNRIPLVGGINNILGGVLGLVKAIILLYIAAIVISIIVSFTGGEFQNIIDNSYAFRLFYQYNPFLTLIPGI